MRKSCDAEIGKIRHLKELKVDQRRREKAKILKIENTEARKSWKAEPEPKANSEKLKS